MTEKVGILKVILQYQKRNRMATNSLVMFDPDPSVLLNLGPRFEICSNECQVIF